MPVLLLHSAFLYPNPVVHTSHKSDTSPENSAFPESADPRPPPEYEGILFVFPVDWLPALSVPEILLPVYGIVPAFCDFPDMLRNLPSVLRNPLIAAFEIPSVLSTPGFLFREAPAALSSVHILLWLFSDFFQVLPFLPSALL